MRALVVERRLTEIHCGRRRRRRSSGRVHCARALADDGQGLGAATDEAMLVEAAGGRVLIHPLR